MIFWREVIFILVQERIKNKRWVKRPLVLATLALCLGIIGGNILQCQQYVSFFIWLAIVLALLGLFFYLSYTWQSKLLFLGGILLGLLSIFYQPMTREAHLFQTNQSYELQGDIQTVKQTDYGKWLTLKRVQVKRGTTWQSLKSQVSLQLTLDTPVSKSDYLWIKAKKLAPAMQMNPSDFDQVLYEKAQKQLGRFKVQTINQCKEKTTWLERCQERLTEAVKALYDEPVDGMLLAALIGDTSYLSPTVKTLYNECGISHVLSISGFHISVIIQLMLVILVGIALPYEMRQIVLLLGIWGYTYLTGGAVPTVRAAIMASCLLGARLLWEEVDQWTALALAAVIILIRQPYQLFMVGFQLSFGAMIAILGFLQKIEQDTLEGEYQVPKWQQTIGMWLAIQGITWPILAYHFYEIPFIASLANLMIVPLFSVIIQVGLMSIGCELIGLGLGHLLANGVTLLLKGIEIFLQAIGKMPLATLCLGRPHALVYVAYGLLLGLILLHLYGVQIRKCYQVIGVSVCVGLVSIQLLFPGTLKVACLYVGQGDGSVIETPHHKLIVIDGGKPTESKKVADYIHYLGETHIDVMMVSHSDDDHMGGLLELLKTDYSVGQVILSACDTSNHLKPLLSLCQQKQIPVYRMNVGDCLQLDGVDFQCYAPFEGETSQGNDSSLVCKMTYGHFSMLGTGDKGKDSDDAIYQQIGPVTVLKVSHHGSRTGTDEEMLLKLKPSYAMISCGQRNRYGHPHEEVLNLLRETHVTTNRTDQVGMICYETDGTYLKKQTFRKEVPYV